MSDVAWTGGVVIYVVVEAGEVNRFCINAHSEVNKICQLILEEVINPVTAG